MNLNTLADVKEYASSLPIGSESAVALRFLLKKIASLEGNRDSSEFADSVKIQAHSHMELVSAENYGHCFVANKESTTRWIVNPNTMEFLLAQVQTGINWVNLSPMELKDLMDDLDVNDAIDCPDDAGAYKTFGYPQWAIEDIEDEKYMTQRG